MNDLEQIQRFYKNSDTEKLIELSKHPEELQREIIPILQKELLERGQKEDVQFLDNYLSKPIITKNKNKNKNNGIAQIVGGIIFFLIGIFQLIVFISNNDNLPVSRIIFMVLGIVMFSLGIKIRKKYKQDNEKH